MLLKNHYQLINSKICSNACSRYDVKLINGNTVNLKDLSMAHLYMFPNKTTLSFPSNKYIRKEYLYVLFGNGTDGVPTAVDKDDYTLNSYNYSIIISTDGTPAEMAKTLPNNANELDNIGKIQLTIKNTSSSAATFCELGMFICTTTGTFSGSELIMFHREVFEPITLQRNESTTYTVSYSLE